MHNEQNDKSRQTITIYDDKFTVRTILTSASQAARQLNAALL